MTVRMAMRMLVAMAALFLAVTVRVALIMRVAMRMPVRVFVTAVAGTVAVTMTVRVGFHMIARDFFETRFTVTISLRRRRVIGMLRMRSCLIEGMRKLGPDIGLLGRIVGIAPALTFQMESGCRHQLLEGGFAALRTLSQGIGAQLLQSIESVLTGFTLIIENRHSLVILPAECMQPVTGFGPRMIAL